MPKPMPVPCPTSPSTNARVLSLIAALLGGVATLLVLPRAAAAADTAHHCRAIAADADRLACYDRAFGQSDAPTADRTEARSRAPTDARNDVHVDAHRDARTVAPLPALQASAPTASQLERLAPTLTRQWDLDGATGPSFEPRPYRAVYLLPVTWTDDINRQPSSPAAGHSVLSELNLKAAESKYQISLKARFAQHVLGTPLSLWGGYTQSSRWQVYNGRASRPFRETNYEPEVMLVWPLSGELMGWKLRMASLSLNHQSNGRSLPLSRSWNRVIATLAAERGDWTAELRPWVRLREAADDDDNPDIEDHIGRAELRLVRHWRYHALTVQLRHSLRGGERSHGSAQLDWAFPLAGALQGYVQVFSGHGESLVDYNVQQTKFGLGVSIAGWR
jgi:phospholipase A1/A2